MDLSFLASWPVDGIEIVGADSASIDLFPEFPLILWRHIVSDFKEIFVVSGDRFSVH